MGMAGGFGGVVFDGLLSGGTGWFQIALIFVAGLFAGMMSVRLGWKALLVAASLGVGLPTSAVAQHSEEKADFIGPGAVWRLKAGYPKYNEHFESISQNPNNRAGPGQISVQHKTGAGITTFRFTPPPNELVVGQSYRIRMDAVGISQDLGVGAAIGMMWTGSPCRSVHEGRLVGSKQPNSSFYIIPRLNRPSEVPNWDTYDELTFEFRPSNFRSDGELEYPIVFGVIQGGGGYVYEFEPYRPAPSGGARGSGGGLRIPIGGLLGAILGPILLNALLNGVTRGRQQLDPGQEGGEAVEYTLDVRTENGRVSVAADGQDRIWLYAKVLCNRPSVNTVALTAGVRFAFEGEPWASGIEVLSEQSTGGFQGCLVFCHLSSEDPIPGPEASVQVRVAARSAEGQPMEMTFPLRIEPPREASLEVLA